MLTTEFVNRIRDKVKEYGTQKDAAQAFGISEQYLSDVLRGRREPGESLCRAFGVMRVVTYVSGAGACVRCGYLVTGLPLCTKCGTANPDFEPPAVSA